MIRGGATKIIDRGETVPVSEPAESSVNDKFYISKANVKFSDAMPGTKFLCVYFMSLWHLKSTRKYT